MSRMGQPYRKGSLLRTPGSALEAMLRGRTLHGTNPADVARMAAKLQAAGKRSRKRPPQPPRPPRSR